MDTSVDVGTHWLPISEAAPRLGMTVDGLRSRIRRGLVTPRKGNDGRLLVPVSADRLPTVHDQSADVSTDASEAPELLDEVVELRVALARAEERLHAAEQRAAEARALLEKREADLGAAVAREQARADRLEAELAEAKKPVLVRLIEAIRRR